MLDKILGQQLFLSGISKSKKNLVEYKGTGVCIGYFLPMELAAKFALNIPGAEPLEDLHITLCYLGKRENISSEQLENVKNILQEFSQELEPMEGKIGGIGRFSGSHKSDSKDPFYLSVNVPGLESVYMSLVEMLNRSGVFYTPQNSFTPHVTLAYINKEENLPLQRIDPEFLKIDSLSLTVGEGNIGRINFQFKTKTS